MPNHAASHRPPAHRSFAMHGLRCTTRTGPGLQVHLRLAGPRLHPHRCVPPPPSSSYGSQCPGLGASIAVRA